MLNNITLVTSNDSLNETYKDLKYQVSDEFLVLPPKENTKRKYFNQNQYHSRIINMDTLQENKNQYSIIIDSVTKKPIMLKLLAIG